MAKFFVCSDIHSAYTPWIKALNEAEFDLNNGDHKIIVCGDLFDRLSESREVYNFAKDMIDKGKLIYIKGNHEWLLKQAVNQILKGEIPDYHHFSNGTVSTIAQLCYMSEFDFKMYLSTDTIEHIKETMTPILNWIDKVTVNYIELKNHILVHSWIPTNVVYNDASKMWHARGKEHTYNPDWCNASQLEWDEASWGNPFQMVSQGLNQTGKTIIFGHFHTSYQWAKDGVCSEFGPDAKFEPYYGNGFISIDACTAHSGKCNVIVVEDEFLEG